MDRSRWGALPIGNLSVLVLAIVVFCAVGTAQDAVTTGSAESDQFLSSYEGQKVSAVQIAGATEEASSKYADQLQQKAGEPFSKEKVNNSIAALKKAGNFQQVKVQVVAESNGLHVVFNVQPAIYLGIFEFSGAKQFPYTQLIQATNYPIQTAFNPAEISEDADSLRTYFRQLGYFLSDVQPRVSVDSAHAVANVDFATTLNKRGKFGRTILEGAPDQERAKLQQKTTSLVARFKGADIRPGKTYKRTNLDKAANYIQSTLEKQGYLGAQVSLSGAEYHQDTNRADIHFHVDPGEITHVEIDGVHLWPWTKKSLLPVYQGIGVNDETVLEGQQALTNYFQGKGYFDVKVESNRTKTDKGELITYRVSKEQKHKVTSTSITGNSQIKSAELTPQIAIEKKHFFSAGKFNDHLLSSSVKNITAVYKSEGFSNVQVTPQVKRNGGNIQVSFHVVEGPRDIVNSLTVQGANTLPEGQYAPNGLQLAQGQPYSQKHVAADRGSIIANYLRAGYLRASFRETATEVSKSEPHRINVVYHIDEGPRVITGQIITLGREHTDQRVFSRDLKALKPGKPLAESDLFAASAKLYDHTGVFDWAEVDPKAPIQITPPQNDVLVKVHESKRNELTYGFGFEVIRRGGSVPTGTVALPNLPPVGLPSNFTTSLSTFYGPRGTFQYTRNNLRGKAESMSVTAFGGRLDQRVAFYYIDPSFRWTSWKATSSALVERNEENPIFSSQQEHGTFQLQRPIDRSGHDLLFFQYTFSKVNLTRVLIPDLVPLRDRSIRLSTLSANLTRDSRDNTVDEHSGVLRSLEIDFNTKALGSSVNFAKLTAQAAFYKEKFHHIVWAESIRVGMAQPFANSFVPISEVFFSGGGNTLRGIPLDSAGQQRTVPVCSSGSSACSKITVPTGGNEQLILNSEARIPLPIKKGLSLVTFYDGGGVFPYVGFHDFTKYYTNNVGFGLRYATPVGPIRIDVGHNFNPIPGVPSNNYFIGIGQAF